MFDALVISIQRILLVWSVLYRREVTDNEPYYLETIMPQISGILSTVKQ